MGETVHGVGTETEYGENSTWGRDRDRVWGKQYMGWGHTEYGVNSTWGRDRQRQSIGKTVHGVGTDRVWGNSTWGGDRVCGKHGAGSDRV